MLFFNGMYHHLKGHSSDLDRRLFQHSARIGAAWFAFASSGAPGSGHAGDFGKYRAQGLRRNRAAPDAVRLLVVVVWAE